MSNNELRKDFYTNCLTIEYEGEFISKEQAETIAMRYLVEGNTEKYEMLKAEILRVKQEAKKMYPDD